GAGPRALPSSLPAALLARRGVRRRGAVHGEPARGDRRCCGPHSRGADRDRHIDASVLDPRARGRLRRRPGRALRREEGPRPEPPGVRGRAQRARAERAVARRRRTAARRARGARRRARGVRCGALPRPRRAGRVPANRRARRRRVAAEPYGRRRRLGGRRPDRDPRVPGTRHSRRRDAPRRHSLRRPAAGRARARGRRRRARHGARACCSRGSRGARRPAPRGAPLRRAPSRCPADCGNGRRRLRGGAPMSSERPGRSEFLVFGKPVIGDGEIAEVVDSLRSGWIGTGPKVQEFERMLSEYLRVHQVRCVSSCTAALMLGLKTLGVGAGDEVIVPTMTFIASANAVEHVGATPVFVDSEPGTGLIDLEAAEAAITPRTRAIMPVHLAGRPVDPVAVNALRDRHGILVIEDAAHAIGAEWQGVRIGGHGNLAAYSFYVTKNITTIEGGALSTEDAELAERVERLALHGLSLGAWQRFSDAGYRHYEVEEPGFKFNMTDVQAAVGLHQLPRLDEWIDARERLWRA